MSHPPETPLEFIGMVQPRRQSEIHPAQGWGIDPGYLRASAQAHDTGGFDRILIGWFSNGPDGLQIATHAAAHTERVSLLVAHRPGFQAPTTAARAFATLDQLSAGRAAIHVITGGDDAEQHRDGDWLDKDARYARTDEYVGILKRIWTESAPVDHEGPHYRIVGASTELRTRQRPRIPIYFGGASDAAIDVAGRHADVYALWGETHAQVREIIARVRASAARYGREPRFSLSFRPILAATESDAWAPRTSWPPSSGCAAKARSARPAPIRPMPARSACSPPPPSATVRKAASTLPLRPPPAPVATPLRWSARPSRSPKPSSNTTPSV